jgi:metallo-beta-lactamase family protein
VINASLARRGVLVIPSFAIGRTQEVLYAIGQLQAAGRISACSIYVDSPMGIAADDIMERHPEATRFDLRERFGAGDENIGAKHVTNCRTQAESIKLNDLTSDAIIIASSGMAAGGRVLHHLRNRLGRANDTVCLVGFQSPGTLGQQLLAGQKRPNVMGVPIDVRATICHIDGFSAHADRNELLRWFGNFTSKPRTYIVHADPGPAASLAAAIQSQYGFTATPAHQGEVVEI